MSVEISFGGVCRDIDKLPEESMQLKAFFMDKIVPAVWDDFSKNYAMTRGTAYAPRNFSLELSEKGCEVGGSISVRF